MYNIVNSTLMECMKGFIIHALLRRALLLGGMMAAPLDDKKK